MRSSLSTLPTELVEIITSTLSQKDLCAVRLTCKALDQKTLDCFGRECFSIRQTDLSRHSLQTLQSISQAEHFKHHVQTLLIKEWDDMDGPRLGREFHWQRVEDSDIFRQVDMRLSSGARMLHDVLANMVNCRSFRFHSTSGLEEQYESNYVSPSDAINLIHSIVIETGLRVKSFYIDFEAQQRQADVDVKRLQTEALKQPAFIAAWRDLEELRLEFRLNDHNLDWAQHLVLCTTSLKVLSLDLHFFCPDFIGNLLSLHASLHGLQELRLARFSVSQKDLLAFLLLCRFSLRVLYFRSVFIHDGTWVQSLAQLGSFPLLEDIEVSWLAQCEEKRVQVQFPALDKCSVVPGTGGKIFGLTYKKWNCGKPRVWGVSFHGRIGMDKALEILAESALPTRWDN